LSRAFWIACGRRVSRTDGSPIERIGATYVLTAHQDWRIRELIVTDPERINPWLVA
jgi:hypothetical protein